MHRREAKPTGGSAVKDGYVLSEVHMTQRGGSGILRRKKKKDDLTSTTFFAFLGDLGSPLYDENDHDADAPKETDFWSFVINHRMATTLRDCGMQVWSGSLLLADFLLASKNSHWLNDSVLMEIGAGTGLPSLVAAKVGAKVVFATDVYNVEEIYADEPCPLMLRLCARNAVENDVGNIVRVRSFDLEEVSHPSEYIAQKEKKDFDWTPDDKILFDAHCNVIIAADIIYLNSFSFTLAKSLFHLLLKTNPTPKSNLSDSLSNVPLWSRVLFLAIELRVQFSLVKQIEETPAWNFFIDTLQALNLDYSENHPHKLQVRWGKVDIDQVPQRFDYERCNELELWQFFLITVM